MKLSKGVIKNKPLKVVVYGPEGIGKSTFASMFPNPLFIDTEGSTAHLDVLRVDPAPVSFTELLEIVRQLRGKTEAFDTLVIDTADWTEKLCIESVCSERGIKSIEDAGYGKGYVFVAEAFGKLLNLLNDLIDAGINVVVTAHAAMRKFEQPDELGAYDRWELKMGKKTAPLLKEWADILLFANYKTIVVNVDNQGATKGKNKAQGGRRVMYTSHHPCWDAKNRFGLPEELPFEYAQIAHLIPVRAENAAPAPQNPPVSVPAEPVRETAIPAPEPVQAPPAAAQSAIQIDEPVPEALRRMMEMDGVSAKEIRAAVASVGFYPEDTPIANYDAEFVSGMLIADWNGVKSVIMNLRNQSDDTPF